MAKLTEAELKGSLDEMEGWTSLGNVIHRDFTFPGFRAAIGFVNRVADLAEAAGHHPDIEIHYNRVDLSLSTHDAGGVTEKDVALAAEIDRVVEPTAG
ncbi:MAG TPA: 4a-hydroxytetrahydrobiopterin dehydratase [Actinomycetota bacterium]|jgi:4a-hydroxytetrahydrobiopterin dehydratase|nr:4a-hydroxytetrahydrobiopterin dehydratase [Actinomycetota bacterium]